MLLVSCMQCLKQINKNKINTYKAILVAHTGDSTQDCNFNRKYNVIISATVRVENPLLQQTLKDFGRYVGECLPKYVQKVEVNSGDELDILVHPDGIVPALTFLKDHTNAQFENITDIAVVDVPTRQYRFEVR